MKTVHIGDVADILSGFAFKSSFFTQDRSAMPLIRIRDVKRGSTETFYSGTFDKEYLVSNGDLLISMDGDFYIAPWQGGEALLNQRVCKIQSKNNQVMNRYLAYFLPKKLKEIEDKTPFVTVKHLSAKKIREIEIPLPSLAEQERIVSLLDQADALRRKRRESMELLDQYVQSVFMEMFGDPVINPKGWEQKAGSAYSKLISVGVVIKPASHYAEKGVIALRSLNVKKNHINLDKIVYFSENAHKSIVAKSTLRFRDVVIVRTGMTGTAAVIPRELDGINCIDLIIVRPDTNVVNPYYLSFLFNSDRVKKMVAEKEVGGIQKHFNIGAVKKMALPMPPLEIQNEFERIYKTKENLREKMLAQEVEIENQFNTLMQKAFA
jgi:type I restriction enzyme S subunit